MERESANAMRSEPITRADTVWAAGLFVLALGIRLIYLSGWAQSPYFDVPLLDEQYHHDWAMRIAEGAPDNKPFFRAPLYPYFLAALYSVFGDDPVAPRTAQALIGSLSAVLLFLLGRRLFGRTVGGVAAAIAAVYPVLVFFDGELLMPSLLIFLDLLFALALARAWSEPRPARWALAGLAGGLSAIARPNILLPMAVLGLWALWRWKGTDTRWRAAGAMAAFTLGALAPIAPVAIRNRVVGGDWVMIASQGGIVWWAGNGPEADGITPRHSTTYSRFEQSADTFELYAKRQAEEAAGRALRPSAISRWWARRTMSYMREHPGRTLALLGKKAAAFWTRVEIRNNKNIDFALRYSPPLAALKRVLNFALAGPFALLGLVWLFVDGGRAGIADRHEIANRKSQISDRKSQISDPKSGISNAPPEARALAVFVLAYAMSIVLFFVCDRYRAPMLPFLILFGVWAVARVIQMVRGQGWKSAGATPALPWALAVLAGAAILVNVDWFHLSPQPVAEDYWMISVCWQQKGERELARGALEEAVRADPNHAGAWHNLGALAFQDGDLDAALRDFQTAVRVDPNYATAWSSLGAARAARNDAAGAREAFERCLEIDPYHALAHANLGELERRQGNLAAARAHFKRAAELFPSNPGGWIGLARVAAVEGKTDEARQMIKKALDTGGDAARRTLESDEALKGLMGN